MRKRPRIPKPKPAVERAGSDKLDVSCMIGFGYCPQGDVSDAPDGGEEMVYRYLPPPLCNGYHRAVNALLNEVGLTCTDEDIPYSALPKEVYGVGWLEDEGRRLYENLPLYGILHLKYPWIEWKQFMPDGSEAFTARSNMLEQFFEEILSCFPQNRWAQKFFEPWSDWLPEIPEIGPIAMGMAPPLEGPVPDSKVTGVPEAEEGWTKEFDPPRASVEERTEYPTGLWKVFLLSSNPDKVEEYKNTPLTKETAWSFRECAVGQLEPGSDSFTWSPHYVHRWEAPATVLASMFQWARKEENQHPDFWAAHDIVPCHAWDVPKVSLEDLEEGRRISILLYKSLESCELNYLAMLEEDVRQRFR